MLELSIKGIDVSRWQGLNIDWEKVKNTGNKFVFIKSSDGSAYKKSFIEIGKRQAQNASNNGLKIGYYHFCHPDNFIGVEKDARKEALFFLNTVKTFPKCQFPLTLDWEDEKIRLNNVEAELWIKTFSDVIHQAGYDLILYSYSNFLNRTISKNHEFSKLPLWLASYPKVFEPKSTPKLPKGWDNIVIWQYSEKGIVSGITGKVDLDLMNITFFNRY